MNSVERAFIARSQFILKQKVQWFPGHMRKGIKDIGRTLKNTDLILEVHDARIPFSGRNLNLLSRIASVKPILLLMNKSDLINNKDKCRIEEELFARMGSNNVPIKHIFWMNSLHSNPIYGGYDSKLMTTIISSIEKIANVGSNNNLFQTDDHYNLLVMGIPNVGKSTVINRLRNVFLQKSGKATKIGSLAGVTRSVLEKIKICDNPKKIYLYDTPGILEHSFHRLETNADIEAMMRCAVCGNISEKVLEAELTADYLLYWMNKMANYQYVEWFGMDKPTNDITELLTYGAIKFNFFEKRRSMTTGETNIVPQLSSVADKFVHAFRDGSFGPILLDEDHLRMTK